MSYISGMSMRKKENDANRTLQPRLVRLQVIRFMSSCMAGVLINVQKFNNNRQLKTCRRLFLVSNIFNKCVPFNKITVTACQIPSPN